jgi:hypothetical protein
MGLNLTQLGSDNFTRLNENPLSQSGNWVLDSYGDPALKIVSELCTSTTTNVCAELYTGVSVPNDQYAQATSADSLSQSFEGIEIAIRLTDNGSTFISLPAYRLEIFGNGQFELFAGSSYVGGQTGLTISAGDVFTVAVIGSTIYVLQNSTQLNSFTNATYSSGTTGLALINSGATVECSNWAVGSASATATYSISGNAGVASATVSYSGQATGSVTADGSGNYTISGLANGSYTITPSLAGYTFSPTSRNETVSGANITGVNFTATAGGNAWSPVDSRVHKPNFATYRVVNGAQLDDVQTSSNPAIPPSDDRKAGAPSQDGTYPQNSRTAPPF